MENPFKKFARSVHDIINPDFPPATILLTDVPQFPEKEGDEYTIADQLETANRLHDFRLELLRGNPSVKIVTNPLEEQRDEKGHWRLPGSTR